MTDILDIADTADMIVNGYAFTKCNDGYQVLNLNRPKHAVVLSVDGDILASHFLKIQGNLTTKIN